MIRLTALALVALASPVVAQDDAFDTDALVTCLDVMENATEAQVCIGTAAEVCMNSSDAGMTTMGMNACLDGELAFWDAMLNTEYKRLRADAAGVDGERGSDGKPLADALRDMQRAWIGYRDAACAFESLSYGTGTLGSTIGYDCHMTQTAQQALALRFTELVQ